MTNEISRAKPKTTTMTQEYDGRIVINRQIMPIMAPDNMAKEQVRELQTEIVKRWNAYEENK